MKLYILGILLILGNALFAQTPVVENVKFEQRTDGTLLVDIYYDVTSVGGLLLDISIEASDNNGETWILPCTSLTGDVGLGVVPGTNKHVVWDFYADNPDTSGRNYKVRVIANQNTTDIFSTAREGLSSVDSAAVVEAEDAQLVRVSSQTCDTTGKALTWNYVYRSDSQQNSHSFDFRNGKVIDQGSISSSWFENDFSIPESWIDSDSAMVMADSKGGKEFKEAFEIRNIEISLSRPWSETFIWRVHYFSQDSSFTTEFDASDIAPPYVLFITEDYTLTEDITFARPDNVGYACAIKIGAPNIKLDLGGHTISGDLSNGYIEGLLVENFDGITIRNGTIENFGIAIAMSHSNNTTIENMTIKNLVSDDPIEFFNGIVVGESEDVVIRDSHFEFLPVMHKEEIIMANCDVTVENCEFKGGSVGVNLAGEGPSNGLVINNRFIGVGAGILFQYSTAGQIKNNIFFENGVGIMADAEYYGDVKGVTIEGNDMQDGGTGILFYGTIESNITNNIIKNNIDRGITLIQNMNCLGDVSSEDCFFSTGNVITDNDVIGNFIDLYHHELCTGNTWERNTCGTTQGAEIPECPVCTVTAREVLTYVNRGIEQNAEDAQLFYVSSLSCDTTGKSTKWVYIYQSASQQKNYEFWFENGNLHWEDVTIPYENNLPIPESWIDSDSAITVAEENGGKNFRETHDDAFIQMDLTSEWANVEETETRIVWHIQYVSDASGETFNYDVIAGENTP